MFLMSEVRLHLAAEQGYLAHKKQPSPRIPRNSPPLGYLEARAELALVGQEREVVAPHEGLGHLDDGPVYIYIYIYI